MRRSTVFFAPLALGVALATIAPAPLRAGSPPTRTMVLLLECSSPAELRSRLARYADSTAARDAFGSGEACATLGASWARAGGRDSAIAWYARAAQRRGDTDERLALADLLLERRRGDDASRAMALLRETVAGIATPEAQVPYRARLAWGEFLAGHPDSAAAFLDGSEEVLKAQLEWRERLGRIALAAHDPQRAMKWLGPVALASRGQAKETMNALAAAASEGSSGGRETDVVSTIAGQVAAQDRKEERRLQALGARRVAFAGTDGFPLGGIAIVPGAAPGAARLAAVVLMAAGDTLAAYDSLAAMLARANLATLLIERRGSGRSVAPSCPLPSAWRGREAALELASARDVRSGLRALASLGPLDTTRYVVMGIGETVTTAVLAATLDARVRALVLVSPSPHPVDQGPTRARIAKLKRPIFFQVAPEDYPLYELTEAFYQAGHRPVSLYSDARGAGRFAEQFRDDPAIAVRFKRWIDEQVLPSAPPRATRPGPRRRG